MLRKSTGQDSTRPAFDRSNLLILAVFLIAAALAGWFAYRTVQSLVAGWTITPLPGIAVNPDGPAPRPGDPAGLDSTAEPTPYAINQQGGPEPVPWNGASRVTVLIMGLDYRDWVEGKDIPRTDSMILLTVDPLKKTAGMLSIPRDLWVSIPTMGYHKINTAYRWGEMYKMPDGGPGLAMRTVETAIGVPVQYYALIDFHSFVTFIDEMDGLDMHIKQEITVDPIGAGNTVKLEPGVQNLPGEVVLAYARNRYTENDDFDRSSRQQEVILAIREQILTFQMLPSLIARAPVLYDRIAPGIRTNLTLEQVIQLAWLASEIPEENIHRSVFDVHTDFEYATVETSDGSQDVVIPRLDRIRMVRDEIFNTAGALAPMALDLDSRRRVEIEQARVTLKNGTGAADRAAAALTQLTEGGIQAADGGPADTVYSRTQIIDYTGKPYTLREIVARLGIENPVVHSRFEPGASVDVEVILGQDWTGTAP